jgi:hypothetical protein
MGSQSFGISGRVTASGPSEPSGLGSPYYLFFARKERFPGLALVAAFGLCFYANFAWIIHAFRPPGGGYKYFALYGTLDGTAAGTFFSPLLNPTALVRSVAIHGLRKLRYVVEVFGPLAFLSFVSPARLSTLVLSRLKRVRTSPDGPASIAHTSMWLRPARCTQESDERDRYPVQTALVPRTRRICRRDRGPRIDTGPAAARSSVSPP